MSTFEIVRYQAALNGGRPAISVPGHSPDVISYIRLAIYVERVATRLSQYNIPARSLIGLCVADTLLHIALTLAAEHLGFASASVLAEAEDAGISFLVCDTAPAQSSCAFAVAGLQWFEPLGESQPIQSTPMGADDLCRVLFTSGSTGKPKAVGLTRALVEMRLASYEHVFGASYNANGRVVCFMGLGSSVGYLLLLRTLRSGGMFIVPDPSFDVMARRAALYLADTLVASASALSQLCELTTANRTQWRSLRLVLTAGSHLSSTLASEVREKICNRIITFYGSTETGVIAAADVEILVLDRGEVGHVVPGVEIQAGQNAVQAQERFGPIRISCAANVGRYIGESRSEAFQGTWFYPGDMGAVGPDGMLTLAGRVTNVVNLGGVKTTLEHLEAAYATAPGAREVRVVVEPDRNGIDRASAILIPDEGWSLENFTAFYRERLRQDFWPLRWLAVTQLPRLPNGKVDRKELTRLIAIDGTRTETGVE